jgi:hypothetical protein
VGDSGCAEGVIGFHHEGTKEMKCGNYFFCFSSLRALRVLRGESSFLTNYLAVGLPGNDAMRARVSLLIARASGLDDAAIARRETTVITFRLS